MASLDSHTVTSSPLPDIFDNHDDLSSVPICACQAPSPAICKCSPSLNSVRGRESTTKALVSTNDQPQPQPPQPQRLTLKLTLPPQLKQRRQTVPTLGGSFPAVRAASPITDPREQQTPPKRKRGRPRKHDSQRALEIDNGLTRSSRNKHPSSSALSALSALSASTPLTKPGTARVKRGTATSKGTARRRRSSSNFSDTVPRRHKHAPPSSANNTHQQPAYPLFIPASVLSPDDLSSSSVSLSESSESDDECESSPLSLSMVDEQADRGHTDHHHNSYDQQVQLERARVRRELLGHDQSPSHQKQHHSHNQQNHPRAHYPPQQHHTGGVGGGGNASGDETEDDERSSSDGAGSSDTDDGTEADDDDPNDVHPNPKLATRFTPTTTAAAAAAGAIAAIETDPDSDSESESEVDAELFFSNLIKSASSSSYGEDDDSEDAGTDADADEVMLDVEIGVEIPGAPGSREDGDDNHGPINGGDDHNGNYNDKVVKRELGDPAMMVREGWDGALVFATDIGTQGRGGVLDVAFERSSSWSRERAPSISHPSHLHPHPYVTTYAGATTARAGRRTMSVSSGLNLPLDVIAELQAAAETTLLGPGLMPAMSMSIMDSGSALSDTEEGAVGVGGEDETDGGETTDDELPFVPLPGMEGMGVGMRFMLPPTAPPMLSVNPDVTMSPSISKSTNRSEFVGESPRPAEILRRQQMQMQRRWTASGDESAITINTPQMQAQTQALTNSPEKSPLPRMGVFSPPGRANRLSFSASNKTSAVIGDRTAKESIPSPFAKLARSREPGGILGEGNSTAASSPVRGLKRRASSDLTPFFNKRSMRFPTTGVNMFSSFPPPHMHSMFGGDLLPSSPGSLFDILPPESTPENSVIELDDVLCASVLSDDTAPTSLGGDIPDSATTADSDVGGQMSRWDRVPVGLYRQTRTGDTAEMMFSFGIGGFDPPAPFGSPSHHQHSHHQHHHSIAGPSTPLGVPRAQHRPGVSLDSALWGLNSDAPDAFFDDGLGQMLSAGIFPPAMPLMGDGERATTPTPALYVPETKSRKERRKEKKKMRAAAAAAAAAVAVPLSPPNGIKLESPEILMEGAS